jgi:hypothetical protein
MDKTYMGKVKRKDQVVKVSIERNVKINIEGESL